jgi:hypothetical protein
MWQKRQIADSQNDGYSGEDRRDCRRWDESRMMNVEHVEVS